MRKHLRLVLLAAFAGLLLFSALLTAGIGQPGTVKEIVKGVWFREGELLDKGHCNNVIIEMKDYLIVVDANFPSGARLAMLDAQKVSRKPVKYVFDTHHHGDHAYGNALWTKAGAITLAHIGVANEMKRVEPARWQGTAKERKDVAELGMGGPETPKETFSGDLKVIEDATRKVEFHYFGWAHTRGDGFVYLPKEKVICTGDAVVDGPFNYTGDGNILNWPNVVDKALKLNPQYVLPAHGASGGKEILTGQKAFMVELRQAVEKSIKSGKKLEDLVKMDGKKLVSTNVKLSDSAKNWVGEYLPAQVKDVYGELTQMKPAGELNAAN
jgi:cyclase